VEKRKIGTVEVSVVGVGCNNFGGRIDEAHTEEVIKAALDQQIDFFDTAGLKVVGDWTAAKPPLKKPEPQFNNQVFDASDVPGGVINLVTGRPAELMKVLAEHDGLDALWCYGDEQTCASVKRLSAGNLKQVWTNEGREIDFFDPHHGEGRWYLHHAYQVKNIWVPYGE